MAAAPLRFAVLGPGGVGGFLTALLAHAGNEVEVLASDETATAIVAAGIRLESRQFGRIEAQPRAAPRLSRPVDALLVAVKATQLDQAVQRAPASALGDALVIPFLNGIDHVQRLRQVYPSAQVVPATIRIETIRVAPGVIRHTSPFSRIEMAPTDEVRGRAEEVAAAMRAAGLDVRMRDDESGMLWDKLAVLAPMALLTTQARADVGTIRTARRDDLVALLDEISAVARADGAAQDPVVLLRFIDSVPAGMSTSMERDRAAGLPLELDALGGALLRRADRAGIDAPVTRRLVEEISRSA